MKNGLTFEELREEFHEYLTTQQSDGYCGWQKIDPSILEIIYHIFKNKHIFHFGESCSGHPTRQIPSFIGYIQIGTDNSKESQELISDLKRTLKGNLYVSIKESNIPYARDTKAYTVIIDRSSLVDELRNMLTPEQHREHFEYTWAQIKAVLKNINK